MPRAAELASVGAPLALHPPFALFGRQFGVALVRVNALVAALPSAHFLNRFKRFCDFVLHGAAHPE
jgi:hypothetical protein